jgi:hypothetical protein
MVGDCLHTHFFQLVDCSCKSDSANSVWTSGFVSIWWGSPDYIVKRDDIDCAAAS